mmetsp:Transcript_93165/g.266213  ORF Transcript_93165/g.266213 Transcript_93165/m.266213 type:complete len:239 (-) Transcript_93165:329-1045(-)
MKQGGWPHGRSEPRIERAHSLKIGAGSPWPITRPPTPSQSARTRGAHELENTSRALVQSACVHTRRGPCPWARLFESEALWLPVVLPAEEARHERHALQHRPKKREHVPEEIEQPKNLDQQPKERPANKNKERAETEGSRCAQPFWRREVRHCFARADDQWHARYEHEIAEADEHFVEEKRHSHDRHQAAAANQHEPNSSVPAAAEASKRPHARQCRVHPTEPTVVVALVVPVRCILL